MPEFEEHMVRFVFLALIVASSTQAQTPNTVIAGVNGTPILVRTENSSWSQPIQVFSNAKEIVYVPDITTPGWVQWHSQTFKTKGEYFTYVYTYLRQEHITVQDTLYVNVNTQRAVVVRFLKPPIQIDLRTTTRSIAQTTANITRLVHNSVDHYIGPSLKQGLQSDRATALHNLDVMKDREASAH